jgi:plastocyanin
MKFLLISAALALAPLPALAGDLTMTVRDASGAPVPDAVVMVYPAAGTPAGAIKFPWPYVVSQHDIMFDPLVLVVPVGADVAFPNNDKVRHHVYSFSAGNKFELKLYGHDASPSHVFKTAGVVALGCNIHDEMAAFIRVVDTPFAIKTGANGVAQIRGIPGGAATIRIWQPYMHVPKNEIAVTAQIPATGAANLTQTVEIRGGAMTMKH